MNIIIKKLGYIKYSKIEKEIERSIIKERARLEREYEIEINRSLLNQQESFDIQLSGLKAEIENILNVNQTLKDYKNDAEKAYKSYRENATNFDSLCVNLVSKVNLILANATDIFKVVQEVKNMSADYIRELKAKDRNISRLLRLPEIKA